MYGKYLDSVRYREGSWFIGRVFRVATLARRPLQPPSILLLLLLQPPNYFGLALAYSWSRAPAHPGLGQDPSLLLELAGLAGAFGERLRA